MNRKYLLGAAAAALFAASAPAFAADVLPAVVAVTPAEMVVDDPLTIDIAAGLAGFVVPGADYSDFWAFLEGEIEYKTATGWGIEVDFGGTVGLSGGHSAGAELEVYRSFGAFGLGVVFGGGGFNPGPSNYYFGPTLRYETDKVDLHAELTFQYWNGIHEGFDIFAEAEFEPSDRLTIGVSGGAGFDGGLLGYGILAEAAFDITETFTVYGGVSFGGGGMGGTDVDAAVALQLNLGAFSPFVGVVFDGDTEWVLGLELDHPIGNGPFSIIGNALVTFEPGDPTTFEAAIGIRFTRGDVDESPLALLEFGS